MMYLFVMALLIIFGIVYLVVDALYFQELHPDDLVTYQPMYGLDSEYEGELNEQDA